MKSPVPHQWDWKKGKDKFQACDTMKVMEHNPPKLARRFLLFFCATT